MNRFKTYDATGVAPNGRLYAGDLNLLQDLVAALSDYTQNLGVGSIAIGAADTTLTHYGPQEIAVSGLLRTLGIFRAASGFISGSYTTAQRDAIVTPPYGLVILNTNTNQYEWNSGTSAAPVWTSLGGGGLTVGLDGAKGAASATNKDKLYFSTDVNGGTLYGSTGTAWQKLAPGLTETAPAGSVNAASLAADVAVIPVGGIIDWPWASGSIPAWAVLPYGQSLARAGYATLAALDTAAGTPHGVSAGNIVLPDYRGRVGAGVDNMGGVAANRVTAAVSGINGATLGAVGGAEGVSLSSAQLPAHNHPITGAPGKSEPAHVHAILTGTGTGSGTGQPDSGQGTPSNQGAVTVGQSTGMTLSVGTLATSNTGSGSAHQNTQPTIVVNKIMRVS